MAKNDGYTLETARRNMVEFQLERRGIRDQLTLAAMRKVPRHDFVPDNERAYAYDDRPLPIGAGQTISQPYMVAMMTEALKLCGGEKVLEIGTGSGYAAAVLDEIAGTVISIERVKSLADHARANLQRSGHGQVRVICADGTKGLPDEAPFDGIVVTAGGPRVPDALKRQLKIGGRLVIPVGAFAPLQSLMRVMRTGDNDYATENLGGVLFVPLIGEEGWGDERGSELPTHASVDHDSQQMEPPSLAGAYKNED
ncbi:protein-L-isoaspartate(D-aspartate) O-methyltransferase [Roseibium sp.]|uniref:protein-L-isoaspartate(D-aspartate) O-methyltransferase n=1 Tax=Roseibium sp. TaxID=1936156 RepID=UPI003A976313